MRSLAVRVLFSVTALIAPSLVNADSEGSLLYKRVLDNESNGYARVIQLQHAGDMNGKQLATWEHWYTKGPECKKPNGTAGNFIIRESDNGNDWMTRARVYDPQKGPGHPSSLFYQPFLFEFPQKLGKYPAGTILLVGNLVNSTSTEFFAWRSQDHGKSWDAVGPWQHGGVRHNTGGIWEPFLYLDKKGRLVAAFSDERNQTEHCQMLVHVVSEDGGDSWGKVHRDVASGKRKDRPGMVSVAKMDNGEYFMSYEFCRQVNANCPVHGKTSPDGVSWTPSDVGSLIGTADDISLWASPNAVWDPSTKQLVVGAMNQFLDNKNGEVSPEQHRAVLINTQHGKGEWVWAPSPWASPAGNGICQSNRSPNLLPLPDGTIRYTAPASQGRPGLCSVWTGKAPIGALPYNANFSANGQAGWINFGGKWSTSDEKYGFASTRNAPAVAVTGSSGWTDYEVSADVMISGNSGEVGLGARVSASKTGLNQLKKYTASISSASGNLTISKEGDASTVLHSEKHPVGIKGNKWYHLLFSVQAKKLTVTLTGDKGVSKTSFTSTDGTFPQGMAGLVGDNGSGSFKNFQIEKLT